MIAAYARIARLPGADLGVGAPGWTENGAAERLMTQHASLKAASKIATRRNVLKRFERIDILRRRGRWKEGDRGQGLPKTKSV